MARKRKDVDDDSSSPVKRLRAENTDETQDVFVIENGFISDGSDATVVNYTDNGVRRAESEARRAWNYICEIDGCGQRFNRPCRLEAHMRSHNKERPFACTYPGCNKNFPRKDHLQRHLKNSHAEPERNFACNWEGCGKTFTSNGRLQRHKDVHESKFYCVGFPPCKETFRKQKTLDAHIKAQHMESKPYPCTFVDPVTGEHCSYGYQTEGSLRKHMAKVHEGIEEETHLCMICVPLGTEADEIQNEAGETILVPREPLSFASHEDLLAHSREIHPPTCSICGLAFKDNSNLKSHVQTVHGDPDSQPQFPCPRQGCHSVFNRKHNLNVHIQSVHEKQFRFFCATDAMQHSKHPDLQVWSGENACGAPFKAKSSLEQHIRTHHLGLQNRKETRKMAKTSKQKPRPSALTLLTGVGYEEGREVPCTVDGCGFRFYMDRDLRRHLRGVHEYSDTEIEEAIYERDALKGGQFWIGGLDDTEPMSMFDSTEPSVPHTPMPYFLDPTPQFTAAGFDKAHKAEYGTLDPRLEDVPMFDDEDAEMDAIMGLTSLPPPVDVQEGLQWDMLAPVEQYNWQDA